MPKKFLTQIDANNQRVVNVAGPVSNQDVATKQYVDNNSKTSVSIEVAEALTAGDLVAVNGSGKAVKANATDYTKECIGFVVEDVTAPANAKIYMQGTLTGQTVTAGAKQYLSTTAGLITATPPSTTGNIVQEIGTAISTTEVLISIKQGIGV